MVLNMDRPPSNPLVINNRRTKKGTNPKNQPAGSETEQTRPAPENQVLPPGKMRRWEQEMNPTTKLIIILLTLALVTQPVSVGTEAKGDVDVLEEEDIYVGECIILGGEHYIQLTEVTGRETVWSYYRGRPEGYGYLPGYQPTGMEQYRTQRRIREDKDGTFSIERVDVTIEVEEVEYGFMGVGGYGYSEGGSASINLVICLLYTSPSPRD